MPHLFSSLLLMLVYKHHPTSLENCTEKYLKALMMGGEGGKVYQPVYLKLENVKYCPQCPDRFKQKPLHLSSIQRWNTQERHGDDRFL